MRRILLSSLAVLGYLGVFGLPQTSATETESHQPARPNLSGTWALDHKASISVEPQMKKSEAICSNENTPPWPALKPRSGTEHALTVATRGPGFALDEILYLNARTEPSNLNILGATALKTRAAWSRDHKEVVVTYQVRTKHGKEGQLIIKRYLMNEGKSLVVVFALRLDEAPNTISASQIWQKQV